MMMLCDSSRTKYDECSVDKFGDKWRTDSICKCFWGVDKWRTKKIVNKYLLSLQNHKNILHSILLQFSPNLLFYTVLKHQIRPFPTLTHGSNSFPPFPGCIPGSSCRIGGILLFYRRGKQQNNAIAVRIGGIAKTTSYLTIPKNHIATSPPHPSQNPLPHHTSIRNPPILHTPPLSRQTNHFEKTKKSRQ